METEHEEATGYVVKNTDYRRKRQGKYVKYRSRGCAHIVFPRKILDSNRRWKCPQQKQTDNLDIELVF